VPAQDLEEAEGHRGVVGPRPRRAGGGGRVAEQVAEVVRVEAGLAEGVADGQAVEGEGGPVQPGRVIGGRGVVLMASIVAPARDG
jgi:hypothetical protein